MELQSLIETKLYIDYNRRKLGLGKKICIDFLDRIEKKL